MRDTAVELTVLAVGSPAGEPVTDPTDLPDELDELLALSNDLGLLARAARLVKKEVEAKAAAVLGPGEWHRYGEHMVAWKHSWKWRAYPAAVENLVRSLAERNPDRIMDLFNPNSIRKTGVEKAAKDLDVDPQTLVGSVLSKDWDPEPGLQWKWIGGTEHE